MNNHQQHTYKVQSLELVQSAECRVQSQAAQWHSALCTLHSALRRHSALLFFLLPLLAHAQTFDVDFSKPVQAYNDETGYGIDDVLTRMRLQKEQGGAQSTFLSFKVPDGNYKVTAVIGGTKKKPASTTLRAENRRLYIENLATAKKETQTVRFVVNKRTPRIDDKRNVAIKDREKDYFTWDDLLTIEITGDAPAVKSIRVERDDLCPTLFLCGNSTVVDQSREPWASWGQMIPRWLNENIAVSNHAESGLTAQTFLASRRLDKILAMIKKGDYVIAEFGHNDEKEKSAGCGAWYHYTHNLKIFIDKVRAAGAEIIFCTPTQRRAWEKDNKTIANTHGDFPAAMKAVAERERVPLIDLNALTKTFFETLGFEDSKKALVHYPMGSFPGQTKALADNTHFNPWGAYEVAKMVVMGLKELNHPLKDFLRPDWQDFSPSHPDDWNAFNWTPSPLSETNKPDGN